MKRVLAVAFLVLVVAFMASAQDFNLVGYGAKAGLNMASMNFSNTKGVMQFGVGGFVEAKVLDELNLQGEVLYDGKGFKFDLPGYTESVTLGFLDINILAKYPLPFIEEYKPFVYAGPSLGMKLSVSGAGLASSDVGNDYGVILGVGGAYGLGEGSGSITLDIRYSLGLAQCVQDGKTSAITILVGYSFL
jgi:hypothetical protein